MEGNFNDTLSLWQEEGRQIIPQNFDVFHKLVSQARAFAELGKYDLAAIYGDIASEYAAWMGHCGLFVSPELEDIFLKIGRKVVKSRHPDKTVHSHRTPRNILHVTYGAWSMGGHSRLIWRWIQQDSQRSHSVVLTQQSLADTPQVLKDAVFKSHGKVYALNETIGGFVARAKRLRAIASLADVVVLHSILDGSIPMIAFANKAESPPIIFVNHADERFWTGVGISDIVANLRESGMVLSNARRGIEASRNMILPIIISPTHRTLSRSEAKKQLGLDENNVMLLSIARAVKYKTSDNTTFADAHVSFLRNYKQAVLVVIGPGDHEDWSVAIQETQGRIRVLGETKDTEVFYQAADIYVDSFPFVSNTSLLEAGSYGMPLVSRYPYPSDTCKIFGADMPGLTGNLICVRDLKEYTTILSRLVEDEEFRLSLGEKTKRQIEETHVGSYWQRELESIYTHSANVPRVMAASAPTDDMFIGEPDTLLHKVFTYSKFDLDKLMLDRVGLLPFNVRFAIWLKQIKMGNFGRLGRIGLFIPDWLYKRIISLERSLKK